MAEKFNPLSLTEYMQSKPIKPINENPLYPIQGELFDYNSEKINYGFRKRIGSFYEILTSAIFGGKWLDVENVSNGNGLFQPDVMSKEKIIESKSVCWKECLKLVDFQIDQYLLQQCDNFYQTPRRIFFSIFKYNINRPLSFFKKAEGNHLEKIVTSLSENTSFLLFLPFSIIYQLHNPEGKDENPFFSRYENPYFDTLTRLKATGMRELLVSPEKVLDIYGLCPEDYKIVKTHLPNGIKMNQNKITPFPILFIEYVDYDSWLDKFIEETKTKVEIIKKEEKKKRDYWMRQEGCSDANEEIIIENELSTDEIPF